MYKLEVLHYTRKNRGITLKDLASELNISVSSLSLIEQGKRTLSYEQAIKLAALLNMMPDELFYNDFIKTNNC